MVNAKEYLKQYGRIVQRIEILKEELADAYRDFATIKSAWPDGERHAHGTDQTAEQAMKLIKYADGVIERITAKIENAWRLRAEIISVVDQVEDITTETVLLKHYIDMKDYDEISEDMGYSRRQVIRINNKGLSEVQEILEKMSPNVT